MNNYGPYNVSDGIIVLSGCPPDNVYRLTPPITGLLSLRLIEVYLDPTSCATIGSGIIVTSSALSGTQSPGTFCSVNNQTTANISILAVVPFNGITSSGGNLAPTVCWHPESWPMQRRNPDSAVGYIDIKILNLLGNPIQLSSLTPTPTFCLVFRILRII